MELVGVFVPTAAEPPPDPPPVVPRPGSFPAPLLPVTFPPLTVPLQKLGAGHYYAPLYDIPYPGKWQMTIRVELGSTDEAVPSKFR